MPKGMNKDCFKDRPTKKTTKPAKKAGKKR
jgi:hypothetical protein